VPVTLQKLQDRTLRAIAKIDEPLLQNVCHEIEYILMCAGQQMEHILKLHRKWGGGGELPDF
jgi:hypothetical protein